MVRSRTMVSVAQLPLPPLSGWPVTSVLACTVTAGACGWCAVDALAMAAVPATAATATRPGTMVVLRFMVRTFLRYEMTGQRNRSQGNRPLAFLGMAFPDALLKKRHPRRRTGRTGDLCP